MDLIIIKINFCKIKREEEKKRRREREEIKPELPKKSNKNKIFV